MYLSLHFNNYQPKFKKKIFFWSSITHKPLYPKLLELLTVILHGGFLISSLKKYFVSTAQILFLKHWLSHQKFLLEKAQSISVLLMKIINNVIFNFFTKVKAKSLFLAVYPCFSGYINKKLMKTEIQKATWLVVWGPCISFFI